MLFGDMLDDKIWGFFKVWVIIWWVIIGIGLVCCVFFWFNRLFVECGIFENICFWVVWYVVFCFFKDKVGDCKEDLFVWLFVGYIEIVY